MDIHGKRYILLQNLVGHLQERSILSFGAIKSTPTQLLKGELLEALPDTEQPDDSTRIALAGIDRKNVRLECRTLDITRLTNEDNNLLLAISSVGLRYETFVDRKRLDFGRQISPGSIVLVEVKGITRKVFGVVWYIGELPPYRGTMFGVELQVSVFSPSVCKFIAKRDYENHNSGILAWVTSFTGEDTLGLIELNEFVFGANPRVDILHRVVVWQRAKRRAGTACVKTRAEKRGGGRKPWRQKGTGRARQGSIRAPHFIGGGHAHGPKPKSCYYSLPKKVRRMGLRTALSVRYAQGDLHIVDSFKDIEGERDLIPLLEKRGWTNAVLVDSQSNSKLHHAAAEMNKVDVLYSIVLNVYSILLRKKVILTLDAVRTLEERLCEDDRILINKFVNNLSIK